VRRRLQAQRKQRADHLDHLRLIVRRHQVCYEVWPVWSVSEGVRTQKSFELLLCGVNGDIICEGGGLHAVPCCQPCAELRKVAEWILHLKKPPSGYEIHSFDFALHMAPPHRHHRSEIVITTAIFPFPWPQSERGARTTLQTRNPGSRFVPTGIQSVSFDRERNEELPSTLRCVCMVLTDGVDL